MTNLYWLPLQNFLGGDHGIAASRGISKRRSTSQNRLILNNLGKKLQGGGRTLQGANFLDNGCLIDQRRWPRLGPHIMMIL